MKNLTILILIFFCCTQVQAQRGQAIYAELGGAALLYSVNYDTRFSEREDQLGGRIGAALSDDFFVVVLHMNYLFGKGSHKLEVGAGISTFDIHTDNRDVTASGALMYRFQKKDGHFLFRAGISPIYVELGEPLEFVPEFLWFPGISVGYKF